MKPTNTIRLLTESTNEKGDLFNRLMGDLFRALGYEDIQLDVQKAGREIDIQGRHRHEPRLLRAECKAHATKMGGRDMNAFFGGVTRERQKAAAEGETISAYFVSLGGFTESSKEQELDTNSDRLILFDGKAVIRELEIERLLVNDAEAATLAGQCLQVSGFQGLVLDEIELLAHEKGYIKTVYYERNKERTHFALIHADGNVLAEVVANDVIEADKASGGTLHLLQYLAPPAPAPDYQALMTKAAAHYRRWLQEECGSIQLDGLPTDSDLGPRKLELERLFVPLHVISTEESATEEPLVPKPIRRPRMIPIGQLLTSAAHVAILASPGGGKSTLLKRLAMAYAFPDRSQELGDHLPTHDWIPLFVRCRELQHRANSPILTILDDIPARAEMPAELTAAFQRVVQEALQAGRILLLVDGLDEISQEAARIAFTNSLRSFLAVFPQTALVVTSREAGFRLVAGTIAGVCNKVRLAPFSRLDVQNLCVRWLTEVETDSPQVRDGAIKLAADIWDNQRIRALAVNPLLLTTLLVVKRWIGELPRNRAALYGVAVQVLVRTWNVEGYEPLDEQETLAQLSYVACAMMEQGIQQISHNALLKLLQEARQELEAELQFARVQPARFIERVESRSSLLMQTGRVVEEGELQPIYEFRHLTFQEFLAARGYAKEQHPKRNQDLPFVELLAPHFKDERWQEVIPLSAVLAERKATESTIKRLIDLCVNPGADVENDAACEVYAKLLVSCISDEVKLTSSTLIAALKKIALYRWHDVIKEPELLRLKTSKVEELLLTSIEQEYTSGTGDWLWYAIALAELQYSNSRIDKVDDYINNINHALVNNNRVVRIKTALELMQFAYSYRRDGDTGYVFHGGTQRVDESETQLTEVQVTTLYQGLHGMLSSEDWPAILAASWALAWAGTGVFHGHSANQPTVEALLALWQQIATLETQGTTELREVSEFVLWALASSELLDRNALPIEELKQYDWGPVLENTMKLPGDSGREASNWRAAVIVAWYLRLPWSDEELSNQIQHAFGFGDEDRVSDALRDQDKAFALLAELGEAGQRVMQEQVEYIEALRIKNNPQLASPEDDNLSGDLPV